MKSLMTGFLALSVLLIAAVVQVPQARASGAVPVRVQFSSAPILSSAYSELVASTVKGIKGMTLANTGAKPIAIAFGAVGSEVQQVIVPAQSALAPVFMPVSGGYGLRISAISLDSSTGSTGELQMNLMYN